MKHIHLSTQKRFSLSNAKTLLPLLLFIIVVCLSFFTTWQTSNNCLDGDASSELIFSQHLNEIGKLYSRDWYYSTELRIFDTHLVFMPLFSIFSDWTMVRFVGAMIWQGLLVLSFFYLHKQTKLSVGSFFLGASLLLLPVSTAYGRFVLYHSYYLPHIAISFTIVALFISCTRHLTQHHLLHAFIRFSFLGILSFGSGLAGVRQGVVTHVPLLFLLIVFLFQDAKNKTLAETLKPYSLSLAVAVASCFAFALGYIANAYYLSNLFTFSDYSNLTIDLLDPLKLPSMLFGLLHSFGFREELRVLSVLGILSVSAVFSIIFFLTRSILLLIKREYAASPACRFIGLFFLSALTVMLTVFLLIDSGWYYPLYLLSATVWFIPLLAVLYDTLPQRAVQLKRADVCLLLTVVLLIANGFSNAIFFSSGGKHFAQRYEGVGYEDMTLAKKLEKPVDFLLENGYELGYSQFWTAGPITEISDGKIKMVNLLIHQYDRPMIIHEWLMQISTANKPVDKTFLLLSAFYNKAYVDMEIYDENALVYNDGEFFIYHFDDPSVIKDYVSW